jgi:starch phosphorylase
MEVGSQLRVTAKLKLGRLRPEDLAVEMVHGTVTSSGLIEHGEITRMEFQPNTESNGSSGFMGSITCRASGQHGFALRVLPRHEDMGDPYELNMIRWEK